LSPINVQPVSGNCALRIEQTHRPCAHLIVQIVLDLILLVETWPWFGCLGPEIRNVVATACLERHGVIDFIFAGCALDDTVFAIHLTAHLGRYVPN